MTKTDINSTSESVHSDLKPCQHCGGKAFVRVIDGVFKRYECSECHKQGPTFRFYGDKRDEFAKRRMKEGWNWINNGENVKDWYTGTQL